MSKKLTRPELVEMAAAVFQRQEYQECNELYATEDGQLFVKNAQTEGTVVTHKKDTGNGYFVISRAECEGKAPVAETSEDKPLEKQTKAELIAFGSKLGLEILEDESKAQILEKIKSAQGE